MADTWGPANSDFRSHPSDASVQRRTEHTQRARVVLIRPPRLVACTGLNANTPVPSLALGYLAAVLQGKGFRVTCIDACGEAPDDALAVDGIPFLVNGLSAEQIAARIPDDAALIGVSCMFSREWAYHKR